MKKISTLILLLALIVCLVGCSGKKKEETKPSNSQSQEQESPEDKTDAPSNNQSQEPGNEDDKTGDKTEDKTEEPAKSFIWSQELGEHMESHSTDMLTLDFYKTVENKEYYGQGIFTDIVYLNAEITNKSDKEVFIDSVYFDNVEDRIFKPGEKKLVTAIRYLTDGAEKPGEVENTYGYSIGVLTKDTGWDYERISYKFNYDDNFICTGFANFDVTEFGEPASGDEDEGERETKNNLSVLIGENEYAKVVFVSVERSKGLDSEALGINGYRYDFVLEVTNKSGKDLKMNGCVLSAGTTASIDDSFELIDDTFGIDDIYVVATITDPDDIIQTGKGTGPNGEDEFEEATRLHAEKVLNYNEL